MYTPEDRNRTDLIRDDRPYAGLLYLGLAWNRRIHARGAGHEMLDTRELTLGVIGPWSLAERSQDLVHELRGFESFRGWDNQLHNEPAFQLAMERKFKPWQGAPSVRAGDRTRSAATRCAWATSRPPPARASNCAWAGTSRTTSAAMRSVPAARIGRLRRRPVCVVRNRNPLVHPDPALTCLPMWKPKPSPGISRSMGTCFAPAIASAVARGWRRRREFDEQVGHHAFGSVALSVEF